MEEVDHVDDDLHQRERHADARRDPRVGDDAAHHQPERNGGEDHRQNEADHIIAAGAVRLTRGMAVVMAMAVIVRMIVCVVRAHRSTPSR